jgi:hypothetical protein
LNSGIDEFNSTLFTRSRISFSLLEKKIIGNRNTFFFDVNAADWPRYLHSPTRFKTENAKGVT